MAISQTHLAAQLGVSGMTVSRALRGENAINEKTRRPHDLLAPRTPQRHPPETGAGDETD